MKKTIYNCIITTITTFKKENYTMSDNKLLAENTIRRFMKLANVDTLTDNFIAETASRQADENVNEETIEEETQEEVQEESTINEEEEEMELDAELGAEDPMDDMGDMDPEAAEEPEMAAADMSLTEEEARLLISLGERLSAAMDEASEPAPEEEPGAEEEAEEFEAEEAEEEEEEEDPAAPGVRAYMEEGTNQDDLVNEVLKRVTKRLVAAKLQTRK